MSRSLASLAFVTVLAAIGTAQTRPHPYDLIHVNWHVQLDDSRGAILGDVTNVLKPERGATELWLDRGKLNIKRVEVNGKLTTHRLVGEQVYFTVPEGMRDGQELSVRVLYSGIPEAGIYFIPKERAFPAHTPVIYTQGEMVDTRYWLVTYDYPDDKATSEGTIDLRKGFYALSNGELIEQKDISDKLTRFHWKMDQPHATYLISILGGPYQKLHEEWSGIPVDTYTPEGMLPWGQAAMGGTDKMVQFYSEQTGFKYPYQKFAQGVVPDFMFGGMENITAVTNTITALFPPEAKPLANSEGLVLHELAHQWFGDTVTTNGWSDAWINEGWASFMPSFYVRKYDGQEAYDLSRYDTFGGGLGAHAADPDRSVVFTGYKEPLDMFNGFIYAGGASRMFMLMHMLGEENFWKYTQQYLEQRKYTSFDTKAFFDTWSANSGKDLSQFMQQWFFTPAAPDVTVWWKGDDLMLTQKAPAFNLNFPVWVFNGTTWNKQDVTLEAGEKSISMPGLGGKPVIVDPECWVMGNFKYETKSSNPEKILMYRAAPNAAGKARIMDMMLRNMTAAEMLAFAKTIDSDRLLQRYIGSLQATAGLEDYLLSLMARSDLNLKRTALEKVGSLSQSDAVMGAVKNIAENDPNPLMKQAAFQVLLNDDASGDVATRLWTMETYNDAFRQMALRWWQSHDRDQARTRSLEVIQKGLPEPTRVEAIGILGDVKDASGSRVVFDALAGVLKESSFGARNSAINALAAYGDKAAIPLIEPFKTNSLVFFRGTAVGAIQRLGG